MAKFKTPNITPNQGVAQGIPALKPAVYVDEMENLIPTTHDGIHIRPGFKPQAFNAGGGLTISDNTIVKPFIYNSQTYFLVIDKDAASGSKLRIVQFADDNGNAIVITPQFQTDQTKIETYLTDINEADDLRIVAQNNNLYILNRNHQILLETLQPTAQIQVTDFIGRAPDIQLTFSYIPQGESTQQTITVLYKFSDFANDPNIDMSTYNRDSTTDATHAVDMWRDYLDWIVSHVNTDYKSADSSHDVFLPVSDPVNNTVTISTVRPDYTFSIIFKDASSSDASAIGGTTSFQETDTIFELYIVDSIDPRGVEIYISPDNINWSANINDNQANITIGGDVYLEYYTTTIGIDWYVRKWFQYIKIVNPESSTATVIIKLRKGGSVFTKQFSVGAGLTDTFTLDFTSSISIHFNDYDYMPWLTLSYTTVESSLDQFVTFTDANDSYTWKDPNNLASTLNIIVETAIISNSLSNYMSVTCTNDIVIITYDLLYFAGLSFGFQIAYSDANIQQSALASTDVINDKDLPVKLLNSGSIWRFSQLVLDVSVKNNADSDLYSNLLTLLINQIHTQYIKDLLIYQNRLIYLTQSGILASEINNYEHFMPNDPLVYTDADPFEIAFTQPGDTLEYFLPFSDQLLIFGRKNQYSIFHSGIFSFQTVKVVPTTTYDIHTTAPVAAGSEVFFATPATTHEGDNYVELQEFLVQPQTQIKTAYKLFYNAPYYISKRLTDLTYITSIDLLVGRNALGATDNNVIYCFKLTRQGQQTLQQALFKWTIDPNLQILTITTDADKYKLILAVKDGAELRLGYIDNFQYDEITGSIIQDDFGTGTPYTIDYTLSYTIPLQIGDVNIGYSRLNLHRLLLTIASATHTRLSITGGANNRLSMTLEISEDEPGIVKFNFPHSITADDLNSAVTINFNKTDTNNRFHIYSMIFEGFIYPNRNPL